MFDPAAVLKDSGGKKDSDIDLFAVALAFSASAHQGMHLDRYLHHAAKLVADVGARHKELLAAGAVDDAGTRLAALKHIIADRETYRGDEESYDDLQNADLIGVIDRRKGMPIALSVLYIHAGRANGWDVEGLNFPGHFLCRIEHQGVRLIFDAFSSCAIMGAADLRTLLKKIRGTNAELTPEFYQPCTNRDTLIRLQNNIKLRLIEAEDYALALKSVDMMRMIAPEEYRLLFDAGVLYAKTGQAAKAADVLEKYIVLAPTARDRQDAEAILRQMRDMVS